MFSTRESKKMDGIIGRGRPLATTRPDIACLPHKALEDATTWAKVIQVTFKCRWPGSGFVKHGCTP